ncbi:hypothetical protein [Agrobacterium fabrum]|uniref:hypothetical protein n=1 Tax=Agrobacterium fabrum TaxID=1176649 RepID=UPI00215823A7|nr:hypothetical protein [Agrobacterium fabrum]MCR6722805.1 hypothetical protein [Agrobacterium fabrum]
MKKVTANDTLKTNANRTDGYNKATDKVLFLLPEGYELEAYRRPDGDTQLAWYPRQPNWRVHGVRERHMPHYQQAIALYAEQYGKPGIVYGSAHEGRA